MQPLLKDEQDSYLPGKLQADKHPAYAYCFHLHSRSPNIRKADREHFSQRVRLSDPSHFSTILEMCMGLNIKNILPSSTVTKVPPVINVLLCSTLVLSMRAAVAWPTELCMSSVQGDDVQAWWLGPAFALFPVILPR